MKQVSIYVENQPGRLAEVTKALADAGVDMRTPQPIDEALSVFEEYLDLFEQQV